MRRRTDDNQAEIVRALQQLGASVVDTSSIGAGFPDLVIGLRGANHLIEIKDGIKSPSRRQLTELQKTFRLIWNGSAPITIKSVDDAVEWVQSPFIYGMRK